MGQCERWRTDMSGWGGASGTCQFACGRKSFTISGTD